MNPAHSLVSIIIPAYNALRWLEKTLNSALAQTYSNIEVLVVDDGSTDGAGQWLSERYGLRVHYLWKENGGVSSARNFGLRHASGEYIQFLDADDLLLPQKIATHVAFLETRPEVALVYCDCLCFCADQPDKTYPWPYRDRYCSGVIFKEMVEGGFILPHMALTRRKWIDVAGFFDENLNSAADWDFWLRMAWRGARFFYLDTEPLVLYRVHSDSMSSNHVFHGRDSLRVLKKMRSYVGARSIQQQLGIDRAEGRWRFAVGKALTESGKLAEGWLEMVCSLRQDRRSLAYKLSSIALTPFLGVEATRAVQLHLKELKDSLLSLMLKKEPA